MARAAARVLTFGFPVVFSEQSLENAGTYLAVDTNKSTFTAQQVLQRTLLGRHMWVQESHVATLKPKYVGKNVGWGTLCRVGHLPT